MTLFLRCCQGWQRIRQFSKSSLQITVYKRFQSVKAIDINTNVSKDVILFKHENPRFFKALNLFALCQFGFWAYLSQFAFNHLRDAPADSNETVWWKKINLGENQYRYGITILAFTVGWGCLALSWTFTLRSVRYLILRKGGKDLTIVTYTPVGPNRMFTLGLENVSCMETRQGAKTQLPIKVKGHRFYYLLDKSGEFKQPTLFDHTAGIRRNLKK